jgi:branched-subunit amino acid aminotransferase/4-amino-4-deoxychorismate lyase
MRDDGGAVVEMVSSSHGGNDRLSRHKTLNYWPRRLAYEEARAIGADEAILFGLDGSAGLLQEGSRSNLFVVVGDATLVTPDLSAPILPGVMRAVVLDFARRTELAVEERAPESFKPGGIPGTWIQARKVREAFLTNSVRGIIPVREMFSYTYPAPGPWTQRLWEPIREWLESGGIDS